MAARAPRRCFPRTTSPVPRRAGEENPMARLHAVRAQDVCSDVLLDELLAVAPYRQGKDQVLQASLRRNFENRVPPTRRAAGRGRQRWGVTATDCSARSRRSATPWWLRALSSAMSASTVERSLARSPLAPARTIEMRRSGLCHGACVVLQLARVATARSGGRGVRLKH
jgi:hypothetical protein